MPFGVHGVFIGAASVFFAFLGFDAISTAAEDVKDPQKNMPVGIIGALVGSNVVYIIVCLVLTGMLPYYELNVPDSIAFALYKVGQNVVASGISVGAVLGITDSDFCVPLCHVLNYYRNEPGWPVTCFFVQNQ